MKTIETQTHASPTETQVRNAFRISLITAGALGLMAVYFFVTEGAEHRFLDSSVQTGLVSAAGLFSAWLARRGRSNLGIGLLIVIMLMAATVGAFTVGGQGILIAMTTLILIFGIATTTLPRTLANRAVTPTVVAAVVFVLLDLFEPFERTPSETPVIIWAMAGGLALVYGVFIARQFPNYTLRTKLTVASLSVSLIPLGMVSAMAIGQLEAAKNAAEIVTKNYLPSIIHLDAAEVHLFHIIEAQKNHIIAPDIQTMRKMEAEIATHRTSVTTELAVFETTLDVGTETEAFLEIQTTLEAFLQANDQVITLSQANRDEEAQRLSIGAADDLFKETVALMETMRETNVAGANEAEQAADAAARTGASLTLISVLAAAGIVTVVAFLVTNAIARPVGVVTEAAHKMSAGDLSQRIEVTSQDEISALAAAFNRMAAQLRGLIDTLEQRIADRTHALETSVEISRRISTILNERQLVTEVVEQVHDTLDYYYAHIYLFDEKKENLIMAGGTGEAGKQILESGHHLLKGRGLVGRAAETNTVVLVPDVYKDADWLPNPLLPETRTEVALPISIGDNVLGVLDVQHNAPDSITPASVTLLRSLTNQIAVALQNARSYVAAQRRASRETLINTIGQRIQSATSVEDALQIAVREVGRALGAQQTRVKLSASGNDSSTYTQSK
ncbi:MAG: GAF domain-containing protein [Anaerolineales bacterium]